jgi:hypothetical protein
VAGCCEHGIDSLGVIKGREFLVELLLDCQEGLCSVELV